MSAGVPHVRHPGQAVLLPVPEYDAIQPALHGLRPLEPRQLLQLGQILHAKFEDGGRY